jgi:hypothetical protein
MDAEIIKKHTEAVAAWKKAYKSYVKFLGANPGAHSIQAPAARPEVPRAVEDIRAWVRALETLGDNQPNVIFSTTQWINIFQNAGQAVAAMREIRNLYLTNMSGSQLGTIGFASSVSTPMG